MNGFEVSLRQSRLGQDRRRLKVVVNELLEVADQLEHFMRRAGLEPATLGLKVRLD
jgi:hypothetical protein